MVVIIVTGILIVISLILGFIVVFSEEENNKPFSIPAFAFAVLMVISFVVNLQDYMLPHHGEVPTIEDVPNEAYIDTVRTVRNNGKETISYEIRWNDDRD